MLEGEGWGVSDAEHGRAALESLAKTTPNLILLDHLMPEMDWFESIEELHRNPEWNQEPVLAVTAKDVTREDRQRLNGYVEKVVKRTVHLRRTHVGVTQLSGFLRQNRQRLEQYDSRRGGD